MARVVSNIQSRLDKLNKQSQERINEKIAGDKTFMPHAAVQSPGDVSPFMKGILEESNKVPSKDRK